MKGKLITKGLITVLHKIVFQIKKKFNSIRMYKRIYVSRHYVNYKLYRKLSIS